MSEEVSAIIIIEVLGRPAEHVKKAINRLIEKLADERGVSVVEKRVHEPRIVEKAETLFLSFAEIELKVSDISKLFHICFSYLPSSVEIVEPSEIKVKLPHINEVVNFLVTRLHQYDAIAKRLSVENTILHKKLRELGVKEIDINNLLGKSASGKDKNKRKK